MMKVSPLFLAWTLSLLAAAPAAGERYEAVLGSGDTWTGEKLEDLETPRHAKLEGKPLFSPDDPLRRLRDVRRQPRRGGPRVELTNGDVLPGRVVEWAPASPGPAGPGRLVVLLDDPRARRDFGAGRIAVREECVRRIASGDGETSLAPGVIETRDGKRIVPRSFRFVENGVYALTGDGVMVVNFADLREWRLPSAGDTTDVLRDGIWSAGDAGDPVVRLITEGGAELTWSAGMAAETRLERSRRSRAPEIDYLAIRPAWALDTIYVNPEAIISLSCRAADEVSLASLPAELLEQRSVLHRWAWRRNANVYGGRLQSGARSAELGVGMHSASAVAFTLPEGAKEFRASVGLDAAAGSGGCVVCRIYRDDATSAPLWESGFLRGGEEPVDVGPLNIAGANRLILAVDFAHEGRPAGADPWDVRDAVDWLEPVVTIDRDRLPRPESEPQRWIPQLAGWDFAEASPSVAIRPFWDEYRRRWTFVLRADELHEEAPLELTRRVQVELTNAVLPISAAGDNQGRTGHAISVKVNGDDVRSTMNGIVRTRGLRRQEPVSREWDLGEFQGREVQLSVLIEPDSRSRRDPMGLLWESLGPRPLVEGLPADGRPIAPGTPLAALVPISATAGGQPIELRPGRLIDGTPLEIRGWRFEEGFGVPAGSEITYRLAPQWRRLVAIIGLAGGWKGAGPFSILLDGEPHWECSSPLSFQRNSPALQIDVPIPPGRETITLRVQGEDSHAAWACAGFAE